jgi:hypothetical protein
MQGLSVRPRSPASPPEPTRPALASMSNTASPGRSVKSNGTTDDCAASQGSQQRLEAMLSASTRLAEQMRRVSSTGGATHTSDTTVSVANTLRHWQNHSCSSSVSSNEAHRGLKYASHQDRAAAAAASSTQIKAALAALGRAESQSPNAASTPKQVDTPEPMAPDEFMSWAMKEAAKPDGPKTGLWEKMHFVQETDDDFVPLLDYTKKERPLAAVVVESDRPEKAVTRKSPTRFILGAVLLVIVSAAVYYDLKGSSSIPLHNEHHMPTVELPSSESPVNDVVITPPPRPRIDTTTPAVVVPLPLATPKTEDVVKPLLDHVSTTKRAAAPVPIVDPVVKSKPAPVTHFDPLPPTAPPIYLNPIQHYCQVPLAWIVVPFCQTNDRLPPRQAVDDLLHYMMQ